MEPTRVVLGCESGFGFVGIRSRSSFGLRGKIAINIRSKPVRVQGRLVARLNTLYTTLDSRNLRVPFNWSSPPPPRHKLVVRPPSSFPIICSFLAICAYYGNG